MRKIAINRGNLIGKKFGDLEVINYGKTIGKVLFYICRCACGNIKEIRKCNLISGKTSSCGCSKKNNVPPIPPTLPVLYRYFSTYKADAKRRKLSFTLGLSEFGEIINKECYYCGISPQKRIITSGAGWKRELVCNGIDRINNNLGYYENNIVPCCKFCNYAKRNLTQDHFFELIERIYHRWHQKPTLVKLLTLGPIQMLTE